MTLLEALGQRYRQGEIFYKVESADTTPPAIIISQSVDIIPYSRRSCFARISESKDFDIFDIDAENVLKCVGELKTQSSIGPPQETNLYK